MSAAAGVDATSALAAMPYMVLKRALVAQGIEDVKSASNKEQLIQIIATSGVDVHSFLGAAQEKLKAEAEAKAKLEEANASKEVERRAAVDAAHAAAKQAAGELAAGLAAVYTPERLTAFVDGNLDIILKSGLFSHATGDGMSRLRVTDGVYSVCSVERGCDLWESGIP